MPLPVHMLPSGGRPPLRRAPPPPPAVAAGSAGGVPTPLRVSRSTQKPPSKAPPPPAVSEDVGIRVNPPQVKPTVSVPVELMRAVDFVLERIPGLPPVAKRSISTARVMLEANVDDVPTLQAAILSGCMKDQEVTDRVRVLEEIAEQFGYAVKDHVCLYHEGTEEDGPEADKVDLVRLGAKLLELNELRERELREVAAGTGPRSHDNGAERAHTATPDGSVETELSPNNT